MRTYREHGTSACGARSPGAFTGSPWAALLFGESPLPRRQRVGVCRRLLLQQARGKLLADDIDGLRHPRGIVGVERERRHPAGGDDAVARDLDAGHEGAVAVALLDPGGDTVGL